MSPVYWPLFISNIDISIMDIVKRFPLLSTDVTLKTTLIPFKGDEAGGRWFEKTPF
jgi:hypothetical protein